MTEDLEIHIIEIPKINRMLENGKLKKWILFLENPEGEETKRMAEKEKEIKEAINKEKREIAKKMLQKGMPLENIAEITGLSKEIIEQL